MTYEAIDNATDCACCAPGCPCRLKVNTTCYNWQTQSICQPCCAEVTITPDCNEVAVVDTCNPPIKILYNPDHSVTVTYPQYVDCAGHRYYWSGMSVHFMCGHLDYETGAMTTTFTIPPSHVCWQCDVTVVGAYEFCRVLWDCGVCDLDPLSMTAEGLYKRVWPWHYHMPDNIFYQYALRGHISAMEPIWDNDNCRWYDARSDPGLGTGNNPCSVWTLRNGTLLDQYCGLNCRIYASSVTAGVWFLEIGQNVDCELEIRPIVNLAIYPYYCCDVEFCGNYCVYDCESNCFYSINRPASETEQTFNLGKFGSQLAMCAAVDKGIRRDYEWLDGIYEAKITVS